MEFGEPGQGRNMTGQVVSAAVVDSKYKDQQGKPRRQIEIEIKPLDQAWKNQREWYSISGVKESVFHSFVERCCDLGLITKLEVKGATSAEQVAEKIVAKLKGVKATWKEEKIGKKEDGTWLPTELK